MATVVANGIKMHYQRIPPVGSQVENAPIVVFIHGLMVDTLASFYFTMAGPVADAGYEVILYDLRGHGRSEDVASGYRMVDFVEDLTGLLDALNPPAGSLGRQ